MVDLYKTLEIKPCGLVLEFKMSVHRKSTTDNFKDVLPVMQLLLLHSKCMIDAKGIDVA